jgi:hypothetical protein
MKMALVGPDLAALTPADRAAIQAAMAQAIPGISARPLYSPFLCLNSDILHQCMRTGRQSQSQRPRGMQCTSSHLQSLKAVCQPSATRVAMRDAVIKTTCMRFTLDEQHQRSEHGMSFSQCQM